MSDREGSATALEQAIRSQPSEIRRLLDAPLPHHAVERLKQAHRMWVVGTGTSEHAAELAAAMFHDAGRAAHAVPSMHFVNWAPPVDPADAMILISHNAGAETAYATAAYTIGMSAGMRLIPITRRGGGLVEGLETVERERSHTYTVSYTSALIVLARLAGALGAQTCAPDVLARVPDAVSAAIEDPGIQDIVQPERLLLIFGEGPGSVTAREGALKVREASRFLAEGYDVEYLLHGSAVPLTRADHLVALAPPDTDGFVDAVGRAAEAEGIAVTRLLETSDLPPVLAQIPLTVRLQMLALRFATERRQDPDVVIAGAWADEALWSIGSPG